MKHKYKLFSVKKKSLSFQPHTRHVAVNDKRRKILPGIGMGFRHCRLRSPHDRHISWNPVYTWTDGYIWTVRKGHIATSENHIPRRKQIFTLTATGARPAPSLRSLTRDYFPSRNIMWSRVGLNKLIVYRLNTRAASRRVFHVGYTSSLKSDRMIVLQRFYHENIRDTEKTYTVKAFLFRNGPRR